MNNVIIDENKCKGCHLCTTVCPKKIVTMSEEKINSKGFHPAQVSDKEKCIGCGFCFTICPDCAITVEKA